MDNSGRTGSQQGWNDDVHIREVGGPNRIDQAYSPDAPVPQRGDAAGIVSRPQRRDRPFRAAWILTGIMLGIGLLGIGGAFEASTSSSSAGYAPSFDPETGRLIEPEQPPLTVQLRNLGYTAPMLLQTGLASASALLILQGVRKSRTPSPPAAERLPPS